MKFETYPRANPNELFDTGDVSGVAGGLPEGLPEQDGEYASRFINKVGEGLGFAPPEPVAQPVKDKSALYPPPKDFATQPEPVAQPVEQGSQAQINLAGLPDRYRSDVEQSSKALRGKSAKEVIHTLEGHEYGTKFIGKNKEGVFGLTLNNFNRITTCNTKVQSAKHVLPSSIR